MIVDWKSDIRPEPKIVGHYREQVRSYLASAGAMAGLIVFATSGTMIPVSTPAD
jgi:exodeoxyribonuclease-5